MLLLNLIILMVLLQDRPQKLVFVLFITIDYIELFLHNYITNVFPLLRLHIGRKKSENRIVIIYLIVDKRLLNFVLNSNLYEYNNINRQVQSGRILSQFCSTRFVYYTVYVVDKLDPKILLELKFLLVQIKNLIIKEPLFCCNISRRK